MGMFDNMFGLNGRTEVVTGIETGEAHIGRPFTAGEINFFTHAFVSAGIAATTGVFSAITAGDFRETRPRNNNVSAFSDQMANQLGRQTGVALRGDRNAIAKAIANSIAFGVRDLSPAAIDEVRNLPTDFFSIKGAYSYARYKDLIDKHFQQFSGLEAQKNPHCFLAGTMIDM